MKAFLLAGGDGTRLRPITNEIPKCLVPICGTPLLSIWLDLCFHGGITDVLINVHAHADLIESYLQQVDSPVRVRLVREPRLLGSAGTLAANRAWVRSQAAFWILYSDVLTNTSLRRMADFHLRHGRLATLGLYQAPDASRCGVALTDEKGCINHFEEKPRSPRSNWVFTGLMLASPEIFRHIPPSRPADIGLHLIPRLVGKMMAYPIKDYLLDIGTLENYRAAQTSWPHGTSSHAAVDGIGAPTLAPQPVTVNR